MSANWKVLRRLAAGGQVRWQASVRLPKTTRLAEKSGEATAGGGVGWLQNVSHAKRQEAGLFSLSTIKRTGDPLSLTIERELL